MTNKIKEIADQARFRPMGGSWTYRLHEEFEEEFARLLLQECCAVLQKWKGEPFPFDEDVAVSLIKEHFSLK